MKKQAGMCTSIPIVFQTTEADVFEHHQKKMLDINKYLRTLWRDIYRYADIDYIEITSTEREYTGTGNVCYAYRVVMVRGGVKMNMRGRCSAGQKGNKYTIFRTSYSILL